MDKCQKWSHTSCTDLDDYAFKVYCNTNGKSWICKSCIDNFCSFCNLPFKNRASICCDLCNSWIHLKCSGLNRLQFDELSTTNKDWYCKNCYSDIFPFHNINNHKLSTIIQQSIKKIKQSTFTYSN